MIRNRISVVAVAVGLAATVSACGGSSASGIGAQPASVILSAARMAGSDASGVVISVSADTGAGPESIVIRYRDATHYEESAALPNGQRFNRLLLGSNVYVQGNMQYLASQGASPARQSQLNDQWLRGTVVDPSPTSLLRALMDQLLTPSGPLTKGPSRTLDGQSVVTLVDAHTRGTLYVAAKGTPFPVELVKDAGSGTTSTVRLSNWDQRVALSPPTSYESLSLLTSRAGPG